MEKQNHQQIQYDRRKKATNGVEEEADKDGFDTHVITPN